MDRTIRIAAAALALAAGVAGCDLQPDAALTVTVEVTGVDSGPDADRIGKELTGVTGRTVKVVFGKGAQKA